MSERTPLGPEIAAASAVALLSLAVWLGFALAGWPGAPNACLENGRCFCEAFREGLARQPANTYSNFGFVAVGFAVALHSARRRGDTRNPLAADPRCAALYAAVVVFLGPGSMFLHASTTRWGGQVDVISMYGFAAFTLAYAAARWRRLPARGFFGLWSGLFLVLAVSKLSLPVSSDLVFGALLTGSVLVEVLAVRRWRLAVRQGPALAAGACFALAFAVWLPSRSVDGALCRPETWLQPHAAWHLLCAAATAFIYVYYRSEQTPGSQAPRYWIS